MSNSSYTKRRDLTAGIAALTTTGIAAISGVRAAQRTFNRISGATPDALGNASSLKGCSPLRVAAAYAVVTPALALGVGVLNMAADGIFSKTKAYIDRKAHKNAEASKEK